jgi:hypothetical protein
LDDNCKSDVMNAKSERFGGEGREEMQINTYKTQTKEGTKTIHSCRDGCMEMEWNGSIDHWKIGHTVTWSNCQMVEKGKKQFISKILFVEVPSGP